MAKLLYSNLLRLKKSKFLWGSMIALFLIGLYLLYIHYFIYVGSPAWILQKRHIELFFFYFVPLTGLTLAAFTSLFIGTEYSDGTLRNKIIAGHSRAAIFFSNAISCLVAALLMSAAFLLPVCCIGLPSFRGFSLDREALLWYILNSFLIICALTAFYTTLSMLCTKKATVAILSLIIYVVLFIVSVMLDSALATPIGSIAYTSGFQRSLYQFLLDAFPIGQAYQIAFGTSVHPERIAVCAFVFCLVVLSLGSFFFRKKDLK